MRGESKHEHSLDGYTQRLVVLQVLGRRGGCPRVRLLAALEDIEPALVDEAIAGLAEAGVVIVKRTRVHASAALQRLDQLAMVCI